MFGSLSGAPDYPPAGFCNTLMLLCQSYVRHPFSKASELLSGKPN